MARGYIIEETLGFCTEYMQDCELTRRRIWDDQEELGAKSEVVEGTGRYRLLTSDLRAWIHEFVLTNTEPLQSYRE
jgi:hypothetical protein